MFIAQETQKDQTEKQAKFGILLQLLYIMS